MSARISPCKDCESREVGCHAGCGSYLTWRADLDCTIADTDYHRLNNGLVFKTIEEAVAAAEKMLAVVKEE